MSFLTLVSHAISRFDGVGDLAEKIDPTLKKTFSLNEQSIQVLFAAANGDLIELRRYFVDTINRRIYFISLRG